MASLLVRLAQGGLSHFIWVAVVLSCLLSLLLSRIIHGHITWDYPFSVGIISLLVVSVVVSLIKRLRELERELAETDRAQNLAARGLIPRKPSSPSMPWWSHCGRSVRSYAMPFRRNISSTA